MTMALCILAGSLYALGIVPTSALISRYRPLVPGELFQALAWPVAVIAWCIGAAVVLYAMRRARP